MSNPEYPLEYIKFKDVNLEETGLHRILEAANANKHIKRINVGIISDKGLSIMSELLASNTSLLRLEFSESMISLTLNLIFPDETQPWTDKGKHNFCQMVKDHTELETIKFKSPFKVTRENEDGEKEKFDPHTEFRHEIDFYTHKKHHDHKADKKFKKRQQGCEPEHMFEDMLKLLEKKSS